LPEGEEDDEFDGEDFDEGLFCGNVFVGAELDVELDDAEHGDGDASAFDDENLCID